MPEPDGFFRYRMHCNSEFYYVGESPTYVAAAMRGFKMVLFTASRKNNFVEGTCAPPSALLVFLYSYLLFGRINGLMNTFICQKIGRKKQFLKRKDRQIYTEIKALKYNTTTTM